jgi:hypothetical protein
MGDAGIVEDLRDESCSCPARFGKRRIAGVSHEPGSGAIVGALGVANDVYDDRLRLRRHRGGCCEKERREDEKGSTVHGCSPRVAKIERS